MEQVVSDQIRIESLFPQPFPDLNRVLLVLRVSGLPTYGHGSGSNLAFFPDMPQTAADTPVEGSDQTPPAPYVDLFTDTDLIGQPPVVPQPSTGEERPPSPYPDVALCILDQHGNDVASTFIVEHKEPELHFTLHLRVSEPGVTYIARAEMTISDEVVQTVQVPFELV